MLANQKHPLHEQYDGRTKSMVDHTDSAFVHHADDRHAQAHAEHALASTGGLMPHVEVFTRHSDMRLQMDLGLRHKLSLREPHVMGKVSAVPGDVVDLSLRSDAPVQNYLDAQWDQRQPWMHLQEPVYSHVLRGASSGKDMASEGDDNDDLRDQGSKLNSFEERQEILQYEEAAQRVASHTVQGDLTPLMKLRTTDPHAYVRTAKATDHVGSTVMINPFSDKHFTMRTMSTVIHPEAEQTAKRFDSSLYRGGALSLADDEYALSVVA